MCLTALLQHAGTSAHSDRRPSVRHAQAACWKRQHVAFTKALYPFTRDHTQALTEEACTQKGPLRTEEIPTVRGGLDVRQAATLGDLDVIDVVEQLLADALRLVDVALGVRYGQDGGSELDALLHSVDGHIASSRHCDLLALRSHPIHHVRGRWWLHIRDAVLHVSKRMYKVVAHYVPTVESDSMARG